MTTTGSTPATAVTQRLGDDHIRASRAGFLADVVSVAGRAVRSIPREPEGVIPALIVPLFFFVVNLGSLQELAERIPGVKEAQAFVGPVQASQAPAVPAVGLDLVARRPRDQRPRHHVAAHPQRHQSRCRS